MHYYWPPLTCWLQDLCIPAELVELSSVDLLHAAADLAPLANWQAAVGAEGALEGLVTGRLQRHLWGLVAGSDAALAGGLRIVPDAHNNGAAGGRYGQMHPVVRAPLFELQNHLGKQVAAACVPQLLLLLRGWQASYRASRS